MTDARTILLVEDERQIREAVATALECEGFAVREAATAGNAALEAASQRPDLVILDLGLPDRDGVEFIRDYRAWSPTPILVLSARTRENDKVDALYAGADDYLVKPFGMGELLARVHALLRRLPGARSPAEPRIRFGKVEIDCVSRTVTRGGLPLHLTKIEYRLLVFLATNAGRVLTHRHLLTHIWGGQAVESHQYLRVYVGHLRQKIEDNPTCPRHILTEIGVGYRFVP